MSERVSFWLVPAEEDKARFTAIISELARRFGAPIFEPHVTLYSGEVAERAAFKEILREAARGFSEIVLPTAGTAHSEEFTKTLFVKFTANELLRNLSGELKRCAAQTNHYDLDPHLSLIYARLPLEERKRLARELLPPANVRFDEIKAMVNPRPTQRRADVEAWRIVATVPLSARRLGGTQR